MRAVILVLDHKKEDALSFDLYFDSDLLKSLIANKEPFREANLTNDQFDFILSKYSTTNNSHRINNAILSLLKAIAEYQPLPRNNVTPILRFTVKITEESFH